MEEKKKKKSQEELEELQRKQEQDLERAAILMKADEIKEETFDFDVNGQIELKNELADMVLEQIDDPEAKYNLYYTSNPQLSSSASFLRLNVLSSLN